LLTGFLGTPGITQAVRLRGLLHSKQAELTGLEAEIQRLDTETIRLERSRIAQEQEIRRTLGYAASDEIIFDFASAKRPPAPVER
jgi:hypothetical protein